MTRRMSIRIVAVLCLTALSGRSWAQPAVKPTVDKWVTAEGVAAGVGEKAKDEAVAVALRKAVEQACGVFLTAQSKTLDYQAVYDRVFANTVGYVRQHKVLRTWTAGGNTHARVRARVSTQKFQKSWALIAHTVNQENNPRVIVAIAEAVHHGTSGTTYEVKQDGTVQTTIEDFFITRGITLVDRATATNVSKRDLLLAAIKDDTTELAAIGARFKAEVVVTGRASAKFGKSIKIEDQTLYQYTAKMNIRVVQTDSARVLVARTFGPTRINTLQRGGGEDKALAKLADEAAPKVLAAVVEAWRKRANISRTVTLSISPMDYELWKVFKAEVKPLRGVQALRLRDITEAVANVDIEYGLSNENLADTLTGRLKKIKLKVLEITANRIKLRVVPRVAVETP